MSSTPRRVQSREHRHQPARDCEAPTVPSTSTGSTRPPAGTYAELDLAFRSSSHLLAAKYPMKANLPKARGQSPDLVVSRLPSLIQTRSSPMAQIISPLDSPTQADDPNPAETEEDMRRKPHQPVSARSTNGGARIGRPRRPRWSRPDASKSGRRRRREQDAPSSITAPSVVNARISRWGPAGTRRPRSHERHADRDGRPARDGRASRITAPHA